MAKELFILFIYDTQRCQKEDDDPQDAVLYFHPNWVSETQKLALCGQLMGATQFFLSAFSCPRVISLNSGKFVVQQLGQFILTVGTDRNIPDWILQHRAETLHGLVQFYHKDLNNISMKCAEDDLYFNEKLKEIFETYVPIIQYAGNIFGTIPTVTIPKSAGSVYLEALQILQCYQAKGVLGGTVLYQNKVVATQLSSTLTKRLISTDPYRIKSTAESVVTPFHLPVGVQLLYVYVSNSEYKKLAHDVSNAKCAAQFVPLQKTPQRKIHQGKTTAGKEQMAMKRDTSRIFTVPEEGELEDGFSENSETCIEQPVTRIIPDLESVSEVVSVSKADEISMSEVLLNREETDSGIKLDGNDSESKSEDTFEIESQRNSDSKPASSLDDLNIKRVLHAKVLSICCEGDSDSKKEETKPVSKKQIPKKAKHFLRGNKLEMKQTISKDRGNYSYSLNDLHSTSKSISRAIPLRYYSFGLPQITHEMCDEHSNSEGENKTTEKYFYNTIADPLHPCFRNDGLPISRSLFHDHVANHYHLLNTEISFDTSPLENVSGNLQSETEVEERDNDSIDKLQSNSTNTNSSSKSHIDAFEKNSVSFKQEVNRRSLSLPLKSTTSENNTSVGNGNEHVGNGSKSPWDKFGTLESPLTRPRQFYNLQLTPLMSKLSILAMEDKMNLPYSQEATPCDIRESFIPEKNGESRQSRRPSITRNDVNESNSSNSKNGNSDTKKTVLYVFGQQNMALLLLLDEKLGQDPELIHFLWESSVGALTQLESHLQHSLEHLPQGDGMEPYSYICLDPNWDMLQRGGSWGALELDVISCLHYDFSRSAGLTEVVLRCDDSTVYGYQCGKTEVFYQQPVGSTPGLPTPADLMGTVPLKAKRRLERDHGIILL